MSTDDTIAKFDRIRRERPLTEAEAVEHERAILAQVRAGKHRARAREYDDAEE